jgi:hypothetical protein
MVVSTFARISPIQILFFLQCRASPVITAVNLFLPLVSFCFGASPLSPAGDCHRGLPWHGHVFTISRRMCVLYHHLCYCFPKTTVVVPAPSSTIFNNPYPSKNFPVELYRPDILCFWSFSSSILSLSFSGEGVIQTDDPPPQYGPYYTNPMQIVTVCPESGVILIQDILLRFA